MVIEAEWLGGPQDGALLALKDDTQEVMTAHPQLPTFDWRRENDPVQEVKVTTLVHRVVMLHEKWYIVW